MTRVKKIIALFLCLLMVIGVLTGCAGSPEVKSEPSTESANTDQGEKKIKEEVVIAVIQNPVSLDPHYGTENHSRMITTCMYNSLVHLNVETLEIEPDLAESWESPSENEYVFHLRKGVKFHDGSDMTAADVKYSLERCQEMPRAATYLTGLQKIEIVDDYTVKVTLEKPSPVFLTNVSGTIVSIIPEGSGDTAGDKPIGTGPYKYVEWSTDNYVLLERFDDFYGGAKPTKALRFRIIPDNSVRNLALEAHDVDVAHQIQNADYTMLKNRDDINLLIAPSVIVEFMGLQVSAAPFDDIHARKAVSHAINKDAYIQGIFDGEYTKVTSFLVPGAFGYNDSVDSCEYDLAKAKEELALSKYPNGFEFNCYTTASRGPYTEALQYDLSQIGVKMNVEFVSSVQSHCSAGYKGAHITSVNNAALDGDIMYNYLHSSKKQTGGNLTYYGNARVDELIEKARFEMDKQKRADMYKEVQDIIAAEVPIIPLHSIVAIVGTDSHVSGLKSNPTTVHEFYDVYYEY